MSTDICYCQDFLRFSGQIGKMVPFSVGGTTLRAQAWNLADHFPTIGATTENHNENEKMVSALFRHVKI